jgi:sulfur carrier protein
MTHNVDSSLIAIAVDGQTLQVPTGTRLSDLVEFLGHAPQAVATALNQRFVPRQQRHLSLQPGDSVLLFQPIVGG